MATKITMPQLGESVTEGTVTRWLKQVGEWVNSEEPLVEVMTDKVNAEIPSPAAGVLLQIIVQEGTKVSVGEELAVLGETATTGEKTVSVGAGAASARAPERAREEGASAVGARSSPLADLDEVGGARYSPLVRRLAKEHGIDLAKVQGTGIGGRVTRDDVMAYVNRGAQAAERELTVAVPPAPPVKPVQPAVSPAVQRQPGLEQPVADQAEEIIIPSPMRLAIAEHMLRSKQTAPHAWTLVEVDMTSLVRLREQIKQEFTRREGIDLTYFPFVVKAVVAALREMPVMNGSWVDGKIVIKKKFNIGIAVSLDEGLIVPVIRDSDRLSIAGLAKTIADLAARARAGRLSPADVQGATFTVNNPGAFGSVLSMPIINNGQAGILAMEAIVKRPVVRDDAIAIRSMMNLALSFDHRLVDGATAGKFLQAVKKRLEAYGPDTSVY